jgi:U3 small nucleolar RNA-associated protein 11
LKKRKLKALKQKVLEKNPDEFYFGMLSRKGPSTTGKQRTGTVHGDRGNEVLSLEKARLLKTQDVGYVRTVGNTVAKEVTKLEERLARIEAMQNGKELGEEAAGLGKKTVFLDGEEEMELRIQEAEWEAEAEEERESTASREEKEFKKLQRREHDKVLHRLEFERERLRVLRETELALEMQRAGMAKTSTIGGVNKNGVKFKVKERKK